LARETHELAESPQAELRELQTLYIERGLDPDLALRVAQQLSAGDRLAAHAREELGITEAQAAKPIQAALASAATFSVGAALPLIISAVVSPRFLIALVTIASLVSLAGLGALAAGAGGAGRWRGAVRVTFWSALAMALTALVGRIFGATT
jgi:VIT1/CCC1 family predicted Fe2+/Mn2+ transporter